MSKKPLASLEHHFSGLPDPRTGNATQHKLFDILVIAICAVIYMVSAWATENQLVLGQRKVAEKSNEMTAIPELLKVLEVAGCIVTIDAIGTQTEIAQTIVAGGGAYLLSVKANQGHLFEDLQWLFETDAQKAFAGVPHSYAKTVNKAMVVSKPVNAGRLRTKPTSRICAEGTSGSSWKAWYASFPNGKWAKKLRPKSAISFQVCLPRQK
jgi:predicted transposase YbfD/YdcC